MTQVDIGGHPPIPFGPAPSILLVFHFQQLTIFISFSGPELPGPFLGPKRRFFGKIGATWVQGPMFLTPKFVVLG